MSLNSYDTIIHSLDMFCRFAIVTSMTAVNAYGIRFVGWEYRNYIEMMTDQLQR